MTNRPEIEYAAAGLSISLPVPQDQIAVTVERLLVTLENIHKAQVSTARLLDLVRENCDHPETVQVSHTGHLFTRCTTCGREW